MLIAVVTLLTLSRVDLPLLYRETREKEINFHAQDPKETEFDLQAHRDAPILATRE